MTATRSVAPTSADCTLYVDAVAPEIAAQLFPAALQRCHACAYVGWDWVFQEPVVAVSVEPTVGDPEIVGGEVLCGA